jgi:hypothetical protein
MTKQNNPPTRLTSEGMSKAEALMSGNDGAIVPRAGADTQALAAAWDVLLHQLGPATAVVLASTADPVACTAGVLTVAPRRSCWAPVVTRLAASTAGRLLVQEAIGHDD